MALYGRIDITFVKMPKYLHTNKYQNKEAVRAPLTKAEGLAIIINYSGKNSGKTKTTRRTYAA